MSSHNMLQGSDAMRDVRDVAPPPLQQQQHPKRTQSSSTASVIAFVFLVAVSGSMPFLLNAPTGMLFPMTRLVASPAVLHFPPTTSNLIIDIGPHLSPLLPPVNDSTTGVLVFEANVGVASQLRETFQKQRFPSRFFVVNCAIAGVPRAGRLSMLHFRGKDARTSGLRTTDATKSGGTSASKFGPGAFGRDFVAVLSLDAVLNGVPRNMSIKRLRTGGEGLDFSIVSSTRRSMLRRVERVSAETFLPSGGLGVRSRVRVVNELYSQWIPFMKFVGFNLVHAPPIRRSADMVWVAEWVRDDVRA